MALCTERLTSSGLAALPAPNMPPLFEPSMKFDESSREMYVEAYYDDLGVTVEDIRQMTEFDIDLSRARPMEPPTAEELTALREKVDPEGIYMRY